MDYVRYGEAGMKPLLTVKDVAKLLQCSIYQVYRLTSKKRIPYLKVAGGAIRFDADEIETWVQVQHIT